VQTIDPKRAEFRQCLPECAAPVAAPASTSVVNSIAYPVGINLALIHCGNSPLKQRITMARKQIIAFALLAAFAAPACAVDTNAVIGGALGGGTGAAVGSAIGGRDGAIIGGAIGGAAGAAIATSGSGETKLVTREVVVEKEGVHVQGRHDNGLHLGHNKDKHGRHKD
jgi:outer membrane lipoprotein SlyB